MSQHVYSYSEHHCRNCQRVVNAALPQIGDNCTPKTATISATRRLDISRCQIMDMRFSSLQNWRA